MAAGQRTPTAVAESHRQLTGRRSFPGTVQPHQQDHGRGLIGEAKRVRRLTEQPHELLIDEPDHLLARRQVCEHLLADRCRTHPVDERFGNLEVHIGFEQRQAYLAECRVDVDFGQHAAAREALDNLLETTLQ